MNGRAVSYTQKELILWERIFRYDQYANIRKQLFTHASAFMLTRVRIIHVYTTTYVKFWEILKVVQFLLLPYTQIYTYTTNTYTHTIIRR